MNRQSLIPQTPPTGNGGLFGGMQQPSYQGLLNMFTAPAQAYMAQPPAPTQTNSPLGNYLLGMHKQIDPVTAFGGYGGLAAMALPPGGPNVLPFRRPQKTPTIKQDLLPPEARLSDLDIPELGLSPKAPPPTKSEIALDTANNQVLREAASRLRATIKDPVKLDVATDQLFTASVQPNPQAAIKALMERLLGPKVK